MITSLIERKTNLLKREGEKKEKGEEKKGKNNEGLWKDKLILHLVKKYDEQKNEETCNQLLLEI